MDQKDIRFSQKKVDESWKQNAQPALNSPAKGKPEEKRKNVTSKPFLNLLSSLSYQALIHLGEIEDPASGQRQVHLEAARETIDLIAVLKDKTEERLSSEERQTFETLLPDLQLRYTRLA